MAFTPGPRPAAMAFELQVVSHAPLVGDDDPERVARTFLQLIGYTARRGPDSGLSFRIFYECFLLHPEKEWTVEQLADHCDTSLPSVYRHLNRLKDLDIIEDRHTEVGGERRRVFRLRYGDLAKAWNFAEAHFELAIGNYRKSIDHLAGLLARARRA
jgi:DNA-binding transcriptional ArsR family regulator